MRVNLEVVSVENVARSVTSASLVERLETIYFKFEAFSSDMQH